MLSKTCRLGYAAAADYSRTAYDINRSLTRYFDDPLAFRSLQARTGTLISGSFALQFLGRLFYPESDLDLYVAMHARREVGEWILAQGYSYVPYENQEDDFEEALIGEVEWNAMEYFSRGIAGVFSFVRASRADSAKEDKVQMIVASRTPVEVILAFHSSGSHSCQSGASLDDLTLEWYCSMCDEHHQLREGILPVSERNI